MERILFNTIEEFTNFKTKCLFCNNTLSPILTDFFSLSSIIPDIKVDLTNDHFIFTTPRFDKITAELNIKTNIINFYKNNTKISDVQTLSNLIYKFDSSQVHVELTCSECNMNYYVCSNIFKLNKNYNLTENDLVGDDIKVKPFLLYMECFNVDDSWVQNDYIYNCTNIHSIRNVDSAIKTPLEDFSNKNLLSRIRTIILFS